MKYKCKNCGAAVMKESIECLKCKTKDPTGRIAEEASKMKNHFIKDAQRLRKKMKGELPLDAQ